MQQLERMEQQIALQSKMKNILNEKQYLEWRKMKFLQNQNNQRKGRAMGQNKKSKEPRPPRN